jgi:hypothetical protein
VWVSLSAKVVVADSDRLQGKAIREVRRQGFRKEVRTIEGLFRGLCAVVVCWEETLGLNSFVGTERNGLQYWL